MELAQLNLLEKNLKAAEAFLGKSLDIYKKKKHLYIYKVLEIFAELHLKRSLHARKNRDLHQAKNSEAQALNDLIKASEIVKTHFPEDSPHITRIQDKIKGFKEKRKSTPPL